MFMLKYNIDKSVKYISTFVVVFSLRLNHISLQTARFVLFFVHPFANKLLQ